ncbi:hypothetical protein C5E45_21465 [Nocardia nova]|uniref:DUF5666 domain-containing protein n=1 Tax=Nocardia nova TaxID=37330 RepID=A0A2S6AM67_9NOCA|nr:DUF5666 domain-containing protein [Nocardia nova]PPJ32642.1 hypothetical protein C5E41_05955 [Nocardia nova]PPJ36322.1 hypothetical protein C5E45_21465 [Nocardia nova]
MTNPSDPWAQRPDSPDTPTEKLGASGRHPDDGATHTTEYSEAYGQSPEPYESTRPYGHPGPYEHTAPYEFPSHPEYQGRYFEQAPGPNATRELPPYDSQWGGYESGYSEPGEYPPYGSGAPGGTGPQGAVGPTGLPVEPPRRRRTGLWIALTAAVFVLVVLGGIAAGLLLAGNDSSSSDAAATGRPAPTRVPVVPPNPSGGAQPSLPQLPGLGDIDGLGATMGTVNSNDGTTIMLQSLLGNSVTVHTDAQTQVISMGSGKVSDLKEGDMVVVQGDKNPDGSIKAKIIISTQLPR